MRHQLVAVVLVGIWWLRDPSGGWQGLVGCYVIAVLLSVPIVGLLEGLGLFGSPLKSEDYYDDEQHRF